MIWDEFDLPRDQGSTDFCDSCRLAAMMVLVDHPRAPSLAPYYFGGYTRHPKAVCDAFSRDQLICLLSGLAYSREAAYVMPDEIFLFAPNKDILWPSVHGLYRLATGQKPTMFQRGWIYLDILFHALFRPLSESNQLIAMCLVWPTKGPLRLWTRLNRYWEKSVRAYWSQWRGEADLAERIIEKVRSCL